MTDDDINTYRNTPKTIPASELQNRAVRKIVEFFSPLSTIPASKLFKVEKWEALGDAARVERIIGKIVLKTRKIQYRGE